MTCIEDQEEEVEVLNSIYDGDKLFKAIDDTTFQYKIGDDGCYKSFVIEVKWGESYPEELPTISMDAFYNKHIIQSVKDKIVAALTEQAEELKGCAMTYTLFEYMKEEADKLACDQPDAPIVQAQVEKETIVEAESKAIKEKKGQLTKSQKRRMFDRMNTKGEMPRGYNWMDIIKHLSQTGGHKANNDEES